MVALVGNDSIAQNSWKGLRAEQEVGTPSAFGGEDGKAQVV